MAAPLAIGHKEPAGASFHLKVMRQQGLIADPAAEDSGSDTGGEGDANGSTTSGTETGTGASDADLQPPPGVGWKKSQAKSKSVRKKGEGVDYYALLGLQHERFMATEQQLKLAYRRTCLEHHPDKRLAGVTDPKEKTRVEDHFKKIQEAYEVLSDASKRREYDSTDDFDDSLPSSCDPAHFFSVFGPAFRRNARWSVDAAVPDLGAPDAEWEQVESFYNFWYSFKSWREFPHADEEDVEGAESREHRRWIERLNSKLREKGKKEEGRRLREFVEAAYRLDPRVVARKEWERQERDRKKAEKEAARQAKVDEEERQKREAAEAVAAAEAAAREAAVEAKRVREAEKRALKRERQKLRALAAGSSEGGVASGRLMDEDEVDKLCQSLATAQLAALCEEVGAQELSADERRAALEAAVDALRQREAEEAAAKDAAKREAAEALKGMAKRDHARRVAAMTEWTDDELRLLDKAVAKFPMGTPRRWEQVASYIRTRTMDDVLLMVKERQGASSTRMKQQEDWKGAAKKRAEVGSAADLRSNAFTDVEVTLEGEAAAAAASAAAAATAAAAAATAAASGGGGDAGGAAAKRALAAATAANGSSGGGASGGGASGGGAKVVVSAESGAWTEVQELALVQALKECPKELSDRWGEVSKRVPGKSKRECFARFKELKAVFAAKKGDKA